MRLKHAHERLLKSKVFRDFKRNNPDAYLTHAFIMFDGDKRSEWQLGYYLKKKDKLVTFFILPEIKKSPESKIFKENRRILNELKLGKVKHTLEEALKKAKLLQQEKYPINKGIKTIAILQHLEEGQVFNITLITKNLCTLNIKLDSETLNVKSDKLTSILDFKAK